MTKIIKYYTTPKDSKKKDRKLKNINCQNSKVTGIKLKTLIQSSDYQTHKVKHHINHKQM